MRLSSSYQKYMTLKLNDRLNVSIGDSFDTNMLNRADTSSVNMKFEYGPIRSPKKIRLLLILPAFDQDEPLETILFHAELKEVPFQAISYSSDDLFGSKVMHCNGRGMKVTENLYSALLSMRSLGDARSLSIIWANEVCTNHADIREREDQVRLINDIFATSVVTTIWLGGTESQRRKAFESMDLLHEAVQCPEFRERLDRDELTVSSLDHLSIGESTLKIPCDNRNELSRLFSHTWFERIWTWQEVVSSRKAFIMYGNGVRPWSYLVDSAWCMHKLKWESAILPAFLSSEEQRKLFRHEHILQVDKYRSGVLDGNTYRLLELLTASRGFTSPEPLDRVFGLHGLMGNVQELKITEALFDYKLSPLSLFLNLTINLMLSHETLDVLHLVDNDPSAKRSWPSFVPNLARQNTARQIGSRAGREEWEYQAAGDTKPALRIINGRCGGSPQPVPYFEDDVHVALSGIIIDEVCRIGSEMKESSRHVATFLSTWVNTALMSDGRTFYTVNELKTARNVLRSTVTQDLTKSSSPSVIDSPLVDPLSPSPRRPSIGSIDSSPLMSPPTGRRPSLPSISTRRSSISQETRRQLRNSLAPSLLDALNKIDIEASPDSPTLPGTKSSVGNGFSTSSTSGLPDTAYPTGNIKAVEAFWRTLVRDRDTKGVTPPAAVGATHFEPWFKAASGSVSGMLEAMQQGSDETGSRVVPAFHHWVHRASKGSKILRTKSGYIGTGPRYMEEGDLICVLYGGQTPFVLRREAWGNYRFIGDCYIHGIMNGEALSMELDETEFVLV
jgi:hypothetical protein